MRPPVPIAVVPDDACDACVPEEALRSAPWRIHGWSIFAQAARSTASWQEVRNGTEKLGHFQNKTSES